MARARKRAAAKPQYELPEPELVVVVHPEAGVRVTSEGLTAEAGDTKPIGDALGPRATLLPAFGVSEDRLRYEASAVAAYTDVPVPDLSVYYRVEAPGRDLEKLASNLVELEAIEAAYVKPPAEPPQFSTTWLPAPEEAPPVTAGLHRPPGVPRCRAGRHRRAVRLDGSGRPRGGRPHHRHRGRLALQPRGPAPRTREA